MRTRNWNHNSVTYTHRPILLHMTSILCEKEKLSKYSVLHEGKNTFLYYTQNLFLDIYRFARFIEPNMSGSMKILTCFSSHRFPYTIRPFLFCCGSLSLARWILFRFVWTLRPFYANFSKLCTPIHVHQHKAWIEHFREKSSAHDECSKAFS